MRAGVVVVAVVLQLVEVVAFAAVLREGAPALVADLVLVKCSAPCVKVPSGCSLMRMTFVQQGRNAFFFFKFFLFS